jgi:DNA-binding NtrC family response regulator
MPLLVQAPHQEGPEAERDPATPGSNATDRGAAAGGRPFLAEAPGEDQALKRETWCGFSFLSPRSPQQRDGLATGPRLEVALSRVTDSLKAAEEKLRAHHRAVVHVVRDVEEQLGIGSATQYRKLKSYGLTRARRAEK